MAHCDTAGRQACVQLPAARLCRQGARHRCAWQVGQDHEGRCLGCVRYSTCSWLAVPECAFTRWVNSQCVHMVPLLPPAMDSQIMLVHNTLWSRRFFRRAAQLFDSPAELSQVCQTLFSLTYTALLLLVHSPAAAPDERHAVHAEHRPPGPAEAQVQCQRPNRPPRSRPHAATQVSMQWQTSSFRHISRADR
jgi:hypothetical protein